MTLTKSCTKCGEEKTLDQFGAHKDRLDGLQSNCRKCDAARARARHARVKTCPDWRSKEASRLLLLKYGISPSDRDRMLAEQDHRCASCRDPLVTGQGTHIDHCHDTGKVRSILCNHCNVALGHLRDDPERIMRLHAYAVRVCVPLKPESPLD